MDVSEFLQVSAAVVFANAVCFAFFMAAMKCSRLQKQGAKDDELPLWVYAGLIAAPITMALGAWLLSGHAP